MGAPFRGAHGLVFDYLLGGMYTGSVVEEMVMEAVSESRLALVNPILAALVRAANDSLVASTGNGFRVAQGLRTYAEQAALFAQGRTAPGNIVTNAPAGYSNHNFGCAVDCYPFASGEAGDLVWDHEDPKFAAMVAVLLSEGLIWGGSWISIEDWPHFQLAGIPVTPTAQDRAAFGQGGLEAAWNLYPTSSPSASTAVAT
jgi:peptidoglycan LD-endopeptidase CwlK